MNQRLSLGMLSTVMLLLTPLSVHGDNGESGDDNEELGDLSTSQHYMEVTRGYLELSNGDASAIAEYDIVEQSFYSDDTTGDVILRVKGTYKGSIIESSLLSLGFDSDGELVTMSGSLPDLSHLDTVVLIDAADAVQLAEIFDGRDADICAESPPNVDMMIVPHNRTMRYVYDVTLNRILCEELPLIPVVRVDAQTGEVLRSLDSIHSATGNGNYYSSSSMPTEYISANNRWYLQDSTSGIITKDFNASNGIVETYFRDLNNVWGGTDPDQALGVDTYLTAIASYDYFSNVHNYDGWDGIGGPKGCEGPDSNDFICVYSNYGSGWLNRTVAFWTSNPTPRMVIGRGSSSLTTDPLFSSDGLSEIDTVGHEWTHGVTFYKTPWGSSPYSRTMKESYSDVFGQMVERDYSNVTDWYVSADTFTPDVSTDALRYFDDPTREIGLSQWRDGDSGVDHASEMKYDYSYSNQSYANVGISNHAFYLLSEGGTHRLGGSMVGIGEDLAEDIWFESYDHYSDENPTVWQARKATLDAAQIVDSTVVSDVEDAWDLVGVTRNAGWIDAIATNFGDIYTSVTVDEAGRTYMTAVGHQLKRINVDSSVDIIAGTGASGTASEGDPADTSMVSSPSGLVSSTTWSDPDSDGLDYIPATTVYFSDSGNHKVKMIDENGDLYTVAGSGSSGCSGGGISATSADMKNPQGLFLDSGSLYIADKDCNQIKRVDLSTNTIYVVAGTGVLGQSGDGSAATLATLKEPRDVAVGGSGDIYISQGDRVRRVDSSGDIHNFAGDSSCGFGGDGGLASSADLCYPTGISVDGAGHVYISDFGNNRIRKVSGSSSGVINTIAGTGSSNTSGGDLQDADLSAVQALDIWVVTSVADFDTVNYGLVMTDPNYRIRQIFQ